MRIKDLLIFGIDFVGEKGFNRISEKRMNGKGRIRIMYSKKKLSIILTMMLAFQMISLIVENPIILKSNAYEENEYYINTAQDLWDFAEKVNSGDTFEGKTVYLTADIDLGCNEDKQWVPIGIGEKSIGFNPKNIFCGTFEGNNHYIKGIYIEAEAESIGLFGIINRYSKKFDHTRQPYFGDRNICWWYYWIF